MKTLLLNISYEPIKLISWKSAVRLLFSGKAQVLDEFNSPLRSAFIEMKKPAVVRLLAFHRTRDDVKLTRENVLARDCFSCQYCGASLDKKSLTLDHVIPESRGGKTTWGNIVACCSSCNGKKDNRTPEEAEMPLIKRPGRPNWMPTVLIKVIKGGQVPKQWKRWLEWLE